MREVEFIKDFAICKKGDKREYDGLITTHLVNVAKVAKYVDSTKKQIKVEKEEKQLDLLEDSNPKNKSQKKK